MTGRAPGWQRLVCPVAVAAVVWAVFLPALSAGFVSFDDPEMITGNRAFRGLDAEHLTWMFTTGHAGHYQPLTWLSLALDHAAAGIDPRRYHLVNVVLHAACAALFWFVAVRILAAGFAAHAWERGRLAVAGLGAALFFGLHPLRVESVAWVTERRDVLSALGLLLALLAWLRFARREEEGPRERPDRGALIVAACASVLAAVAFRTALDLGGPELAWGASGPAGLAVAALCLLLAIGAATRLTARSREHRGWYGVCAVLLLLSLAAKAWGIVLPALLLVLDVWPLRRAGRGRWVGAVVEKLPLAAVAYAFATLAGWAQASQGETMLSLADHSAVERLAQAAYGLAWYPWKTLAPFDLSVIYDLPAHLDPTAPRFLVPEVLAILAALAVVGVHRRWPGVSTAAVAFAVVVSPVLGFAQSGPQLVADRYSYLACMPFALLFGAGLFVAGRHTPGLRRASLLAGTAILALLAVATRERTRDWRDSSALWTAAYAVDPQSPMTLLNLGVAREEQARSTADPAARVVLLAGARELLERGFAIDPDPRYPANLARVHAQLAAVDPERAEQHRRDALASARQAYDLARARGGDATLFRLNLGVELLNGGRADEALEHLEAYVRARPDDLQGLLALGKAYGTSGRNDDSVRVLERATRLEALSIDAWGSLATARRLGGDREGAIDAYRTVLRLHPDHPKALEWLRSLGARP